MSTKASKRVTATPGSERAIRKALQSAVDRGELSLGDMKQALARMAGAQNGHKPPRVESTARRDDILQSAVRLFVTKGYHAATLQDIADELGLTRPAFYYYFKSKQEILEAICRASVDRADTVVNDALKLPAANHAQAVCQTLQAYATYIASDVTTAIMMRNYEEMSPAEKLQLTTRRRARQAKVLALVQKGIKAGEFMAAEPKIAVLTAFEAIHSVHSWFDNDGRLSRENVSKVLVEQVLNGILRRGG